jgi:hypothetical protein
MTPSVTTVHALSDPLKWRYVDGRPLYRVDAVREPSNEADIRAKLALLHHALTLIFSFVLHLAVMIFIRWPHARHRVCRASRKSANRMTYSLTNN